MAVATPDRFAEIKRLLARADQAFRDAGACDNAAERGRLIDEAESWLIKAERAFARLTDRMVAPEPRREPLSEHRTFQDIGQPSVAWRRADKPPG